MAKETLFDPVKTGSMELKNRIIMAPLTRTRADNQYDAPTRLHAEYYSQRASAGLIISEGSQISKQGQGYINTAGIYSEQQIEGWRQVLRAVHEKDGNMFAQLWHVGRISHTYFHNGKPPVAASDINANAMCFTPEGYTPTSTPRALLPDEIQDIIGDFRQAARNAMEAGFDGVEIHGANGYLIEQFLHDSSNKRKDKYGGSFENRARFLFEVLDAVIEEIGSERVALRLSPSNLNHAENDSHSRELYKYVIQRLNDYDLVFLELLEPLKPVDDRPELVREVAKHFRPLYNGILVTNGFYDKESGMSALEEGVADIVSFGKLFLANPDLPKRFRIDAPLNEPDPDTFYATGAEGYTDYPFLEDIVESI